MNKKLEIEGTPFPVAVGETYYAVVSHWVIDPRRCTVCGGEGKITVEKTKELITCPNCAGEGEMRNISLKRYKVIECLLDVYSISAKRGESLEFVTRDLAHQHRLHVSQDDLAAMKYTSCDGCGGGLTIHATPEDAERAAEAERANG
jgi:predicted RNA-binding Zn-ribbon protein involved in translation (DUF1610 family)